MTEATPTKRSAMDRFLTIVERGGNALPHPATLFALLALGVVLVPLIGIGVAEHSGLIGASLCMLVLAAPAAG